MMVVGVLVGYQHCGCGCGVATIICKLLSKNICGSKKNSCRSNSYDEMVAVGWAGGSKNRRAAVAARNPGSSSSSQQNTQLVTVLAFLGAGYSYVKSESPQLQEEYLLCLSYQLLYFVLVLPSSMMHEVSFTLMSDLVGCPPLNPGQDFRLTHPDAAFRDKNGIEI